MIRIYESDVDENKKRFARDCETLFYFDEEKGEYIVVYLQIIKNKRR